MVYHPFRHPGLKVLAVALATLLWLTVAGEHIVERSLRVPLEFRNIPQELEISGEPPATVAVRLRGSSALLSRIDPGEIVAVLDLSNARLGSRLLNIRNDEVRVPYGVEVAQVMPGTLSVELEKSARRVVRVLPAVEGDPAPGYVVGRTHTDPGTVEVVGPESRLKQLSNATTEPVSIAGARATVRDAVTVGIGDAAVRLTSPTTATVTVEVLPAPVEREVAGVPIRWHNLATGLRAEIKPALTRVTIRGRREELSGLRTDAVEAFIDLAGLGPGQYNLRVQVTPTQEFGVSELTPAIVAVVIR